MSIAPSNPTAACSSDTPGSRFGVMWVSTSRAAPPACACSAACSALRWKNDSSESF